MFQRVSLSAWRSLTPRDLTNRRPCICNDREATMPQNDPAPRRNATYPAVSQPQPPNDERPEHRRFWYSASGAANSQPQQGKTGQPRSVDPNDVRR
jgi:hypothetical protein